MAFPLANISITKVWHGGFVMEFDTQADMQCLNIWINDPLIAIPPFTPEFAPQKYPLGMFATVDPNLAAGRTFVIVENVPDDISGTNTVVAASEANGIQNDLTTITYLNRRIGALGDPIEVGEREYFV